MEIFHKMKLSAGKCWIKCSSLLKRKHLIKSIWPLKQHQFELLLQTSEITLWVPCTPCLPWGRALWLDSRSHDALTMGSSKGEMRQKGWGGAQEPSLLGKRGTWRPWITAPSWHRRNSDRHGLTFFWQKLFQVFPTEINSKILRKATLFSLKASSSAQKNPPSSTDFFYTKNTTRIEKSCYNRKTFSQLS